MLEQNIGYMLRNDGQIFETKSHPYIYDKREFPSYQDLASNDIEWIIYDEDDNSLEWFYKYTQYNDVKTEIETLVLAYCNRYHSNIPDWILNKNISIDFYSGEDIQVITSAINDALNQEFCRFRVGGIYNSHGSNEIYFRISSVGYNWFNHIWEVVYDNQKSLTEISIYKDRASFNMQNDMAYQINGAAIVDTPISEFITLKGNPIIESADGHKKYGVIRESLNSNNSFFQSLGANIHKSERIRQRLEHIDNNIWYMEL